MSVKDYPYQRKEVDWVRPEIDREILRQCTRRSDLAGLAHSLGALGILTCTGWLAYHFYATQQWLLMALALYVHGGVFAFNPQTHEFSHNTVFKTKGLNRVFKRIFGLVHWTSNSALYKLSHDYHHQYTLHRKSEGEEVHPRPETALQLVDNAVQVVNINGLITAVYERIYAFFVPFLKNPRRGLWHRYVFEKASPEAQRDVVWTERLQFLFHVVFSTVAIMTGHGFLVVVVTLPGFYGGKWYHMMVHDTMHVGREPEVNDFRLCCRSVRLDPITSFLYWHMEWHAEHHTYAGIPCYRLKKLHQLTRDHWDRPQSLIEAWREMDRHSKKLLKIDQERAQPAAS